MTEERYGKYDLTSDEMLGEIQKTDKMLAKFYQALKVMRNYKDKTNSRGLQTALEATRDIEIPGEEDNE